MKMIYINSFILKGKNKMMKMEKLVWEMANTLKHGKFTKDELWLFYHACKELGKGVSKKVFLDDTCSNGNERYR